jgi:hypothetical protein
LRSLSEKPTIKKVVASEQSKIVEQNKECGRFVKENCGLSGQGAKVSLDYSYVPVPSTFKIQTPDNCSASRSPTPRLSSSLRTRNLDGEGSTLIRPVNCCNENPEDQKSPVKDKIGSI